jgi:hypothetical protein
MLHTGFNALLIALYMVLLPAWLHAGNEPAPTPGIVADVRYINIQPGQTLHNVVRRLYPDQKKNWPALRKQIVALNPQAFINGEESSMKAGARLRLPDQEKRQPLGKRVGSVLAADGQVIAVGKDKISRKISVGEAVYVGDKLITGANGFLRLAMIDNAKLDLRCYSIMVIEEYALNNNDSRSILKLLEGSLRKVTGSIGKMTGDVYELQTPVASVGVRGTEYALRVFQSKGCGGTIDTDDEGLFLQVINGLVDVKNSAATTVVESGNQLYIPLPDAAPVKKAIDPRVLEPAPAAAVDDSVSWWWYALGVALIAVAL